MNQARFSWHWVDTDQIESNKMHSLKSIEGVQCPTVLNPDHPYFKDYKTSRQILILFLPSGKKDWNIDRTWKNEKKIQFNWNYHLRCTNCWVFKLGFVIYFKIHSGYLYIWSQGTFITIYKSALYILYAVLVKRN